MSIREFNTQSGSITKQGAWSQALCQHQSSEWQERKKALKSGWPRWIDIPEGALW